MRYEFSNCIINYLALHFVTLKFSIKILNKTDFIVLKTNNIL
jgi:hypothetical protein